MKENENTFIRGNSVILVPYKKCHVPKYHEWMKSEELQVLTASEPLSLDDEYKMQQSWSSDPDKCTFIVLDKNSYDQSKDEVKAMVGDTNIFLKMENGSVVGEIEIMIAEKWARGKGLGKEAVLMMLKYGVKKLNITYFEAKIGMTNSLSISLFTKIGFKKLSANNIFNEYTYNRQVTESWINWLDSETKFYTEDCKPL